MSRRWEDERWVKLYTEDDPDWLEVSGPARGVFYALMRKCDGAGIIRLGRSGLRGLVKLIDWPWDQLEGLLRDLLQDGCLVLNEQAGQLVLRNFHAAQSARTSDVLRKRAQRERARSDALSQDVPASHPDPAPVTAGHSRSQQVTAQPSQSPAVTDFPIRREEKRREAPPEVDLRSQASSAGGMKPPASVGDGPLFQKDRQGDLYTDLTESPDLVADPTEPVSSNTRVRSRRRAPPSGEERAKLALTTPAWNAYASAFHRVYGEEPARNAQTNALLKQLIQHIGAEDAQHVAAYYLTCCEAKYVNQAHPLKLLVSDYVKIHIAWRTGRSVSMEQARRQERTAANPFLKLAREAEERERREREGSE